MDIVTSVSKNTISYPILDNDNNEETTYLTGNKTITLGDV